MIFYVLLCICTALCGLGRERPDRDPNGLRVKPPSPTDRDAGTCSMVRDYQAKAQRGLRETATEAKRRTAMIGAWTGVVALTRSYVFLDTAPGRCRGLRDVPNRDFVQYPSYSWRTQND
ncbi:hypothetical protein PR001_g27846 [Phytophthora rubi]|uniref:RxLR effector protein n=1 Tax=Phytophthora rubi TaxID=129364 RepID=A0A6A3HZ15_9STRA|nr:hypothetical protein PR001_g27846 [Phytophthora rubi]KAE8974707.1 hypothetical protein PR002_g25827 [Phytophthora rubi]